MDQQLDTRSVLFTDLVGSTELRIRLGEEAADELRRRHDDLVGAAVTGAGGVVVKGLGDGVMATFTSAADAVAGAVAVQQAVELHGRHDPALAFAVRVGVSVGDVSMEADDVFGVPVIEASRLCAMANAGEVLVAELVRALGRGRGGFAFEPMGNLELKGIAEPVAACRVMWEPLEELTPSGSMPFPSALSTIGPAGYVGRHELVAALCRVWNEAHAGATRTSLLAGEPGVGKTRTAAELARQAHGQGALVLFGRCEEDLAVPYQPFAEALEWYSLQVSDPTLGRMPGELVRLVPTLVQTVPGLPEAVRSDPGTEEYRLFEAVTSWLVELSRTGGLVLVLDDLHWAAKPTLLMLLHVLRGAAEDASARLHVLVTYRDTDIDRAHPLSSLLGDLRRLPGVDRLPVTGLTLDEVVVFLEVAAGHAMEDDGILLAHALHDETEGNPFFVGEVIRHLIESGAIKRTEERWVAVEPANLAIPEGVRDVVGRRLSRLSERANEVLTLAAVVGRAVDLDVLCVLSGMPEDDVLDALDEAVRARLVEEAGAERFRFAHALVRTTLYEELSVTRRRRAHLKAADALEKLHPGDVVALAYHCVAGGPTGGDVSRAVRYSLASAEQALAARANAEAEDRFRQVLDLLEDADPVIVVPYRLQALCGIAECRKNQGLSDFRELLLDVSAQALAAGDNETLVRAVLSNQRGFSSIIGVVDTERVAMIDAALHAVGPDPSPARAELLALLSSELVYSMEDTGRRFSSAEEALAMSRALGDRALLGRVIVHTRFALASLRVLPADSQYIADTDLSVQLADESCDPTQRFFARVWQFATKLSLGHIEESDRLLSDACSIAWNEGSPTLQWLAAGYAARPLLSRGEFDAAERMIDQALELANRTNQPDGPSWAMAQLAIISWRRGTFGDLIEIFRIADQTYPGNMPWPIGLALALACAGHIDEARAVLDDHPQLRDMDAVANDVLSLFSFGLLAETAQALGDAALAAQVLANLEPFAGYWSHYSLATWAPVAYHIGQCHLTMGHPELALPFLEQAKAEIDAAGYFDPAVPAAIEQTLAALA